MCLKQRRVVGQVHPPETDADQPTAALAPTGLAEDAARLLGGPAPYVGACDPLMRRRCASLPRRGGGAADTRRGEDRMRVSRQQRTRALFQKEDDNEVEQQYYTRNTPFGLLTLIIALLGAGASNSRTFTQKFNCWSSTQFCVILFLFSIVVSQRSE